MKRILHLILISCLCLSAVAQKKAPKWMNKAKKAVFTVTTYGKDGAQLGTSTGVFVSETGEALSLYGIFKGAEKAVVTDGEGQTFSVDRILGADEMYDVIKFKVGVPKKVAYLPIVPEAVANGANAYLLLYSTGKNASFKSGKVTEVTKLKEPYKYYQLALALEESELNAPILTEEGQLFSLAQADAGGKKDVCYGISAGYVNSLVIGSTSYLSSTYRNMGIAKTWPKEINDATVALYLLIGTQDVQTSLATINDFIATFPSAPEGYLSRSDLYAQNRKALAQSEAEQMTYLDKALEDVKTAAKYSGGKGDSWYNQAKLISNVAISDTTLTASGWTLDAAIEAIDKAIAEEDLPMYHQLKADIYVNKKDYKKAFDEYMIVNNSDKASANTFYLAAKTKEQISGFNIGDVIALLDKAIEKCGENMKVEAAGYVLERVEWRLRLTQYKEAIADYDLYYSLLNGQVFPNFFYLREQAKFRAGDLDGALKDIQTAIQVSPRTPDYYAEEASILIRQQKYEEALNSLSRAIQLAPDFASCYRLRGVCYVRQGKKNEACEALNKAKELGDPVAEKMIKEHCK